MDELGNSLWISLEVLLDQSGSSDWNLGAGADLSHLDERGSFDVISEESSGFSDDGGGFFVFLNFLLENFGFFGSIGVQDIDVLLVSLDFLLFGTDDSGEDFSLRVELSF